MQQANAEKIFESKKKILRYFSRLLLITQLHESLSSAERITKEKKNWVKSKNKIQIQIQIEYFQERNRTFHNCAVRPSQLKWLPKFVYSELVDNIAMFWNGIGCYGEKYAKLLFCSPQAI